LILSESPLLFIDLIPVLVLCILTLTEEIYFPLFSSFFLTFHVSEPVLPRFYPALVASLYSLF